ncbi:MAG: preprotein translocase subunit SecY [Bacillota bacterium]
MLATFRNAFRIADLRKRLFFTLYMFLIFRIGAHVPVPGINRGYIENLLSQGVLFGLLDTVSGGAFKTFSVFAMSVTPYITSSIIVQLLTIVIPKWEAMQKEGAEGQKKLQQYMRYGTVVLGLIQAFGMSYGIRSAIINPTLWSITLIALTLTAGTAFLMWLGELITENGIGNGISLIIFAGIVSRLPAGLGSMTKYLAESRINLLNVIILGMLGLGVIAFVVWITEGQRRIPVQYAKRVVGRKMYGGQSTHIPIRVNQAGVIPIIFAISVLMTPATIAQFIQRPFFQRLASSLSGGQSATYYIAYGILIIFFTYFYTAVTFNPIEVANNMKKYGGFVPGLRPGKPTAEYLERVLTRITLAGAVFLALIAVGIPYGVQLATNIPNIWLGGTSLLIVVSVALETMKQLEAHLLMRHYQGFLK